MTLLDDVGAQHYDDVDLGGDGGERLALGRLRGARGALAEEGAVLLCDDVGAPTRVDMIFAASASTTALMSFAIRHGSGFVQVAMPASRCDELLLEYQRGTDMTGLPQCVTVDAKDGVGTGISASDRAITARLLGSSQASADSFTRPGHVVPLRAEFDRPVNRFRFSEAAALLTEDAGMGHAAVLTTVEGVDDPTATASGREVRRFADEHDLPLVALRDLIPSSPVDMIFDQHLTLSGRSVRFVSFADDGVEYLCLLTGEMPGEYAVPLELVSADSVLTVPPFVERRSIRLADARAGVRLKPSKIRRQLEDPGGALRRILKAAGFFSIHVADPWPPY